VIKITLNTSEFKRAVIVATAKVERASQKGMEEAVKSFMKDSLDLPPACPRRTGAMAASHSVFVDGKLIDTSADRSVSADGEATPLTFMPRISRELLGTLVVHKHYASAQHEKVGREYSTPGTGSKWVQSKLLAFGYKYFNLIAAKIRFAR